MRADQPGSSGQQPGTPRVLLVRTSALGDIVHCLPALRALREHLPTAYIGWVVEDVFAPLLDQDPDIDEVLTVRTRRWRESLLAAATWRDIGGAFRRIRNFDAEVVLDLMGNHKAGVLAAMSWSDRRIGLERGSRREPSSALWLSESVPSTGPHAVDRALAVASAIGSSTHFKGFAPEKILAGAGSHKFNESGDYAVIHPGAAWPNKQYPADRWGAVAAELGRRTGWKILISAGPGEAGMAEELGRSSRDTARRAPAENLPSLVALLAGARLVLGGDTGPLHLAHALEVPTLFIHGPTDPARSGPYGAPQRALWHRLPCSFCHRGFSEVKPCLLNLAPEQIVERALELSRCPKSP